MMKKICGLILQLALAGNMLLPALQAAGPQQGVFLDRFNAEQQEAIHRYLCQELGQIEQPNDLKDSAALKKLYMTHLKAWCEKLGMALPISGKVKDKYCNSCHPSKPVPPPLLPPCRPEKVRCCHVKTKPDCANATPITAEDIGSRGFTIKKSGNYCLKGKDGTLVWRPSRVANVITIDADNVTLDLNNTTIIQKSSSRYASTAIHILPGHKNITIHSGSLVGFTADAILGSSITNLELEDLLITDNRNRNVFVPNLLFASVNILASLNVNLRNITVANTEVNNNAFILGAGIALLSCNTFSLENCEIVRANVQSDNLSQCVGIATLLSGNGIIDKCRVSNCTSSGIMPAFGYVLSQNILTDSCIATYNTGVQTTSGYYPQLCDSLQFVNCEASYNRSTCQDCHGFPYFISINGFFSNCRALNNAAVNPTGGFNEKCTGFEILVCVNCIVENCQAYSNTATNPIRHYTAGFANGNSANVIFRNCLSVANSAIGNNSRGVGFGPALDPRFFAPSRGTVWENCIAEGNLGDAQSIGFDLFGQIGAILSNSISQDHGTTLFNNGVGILSNGPYDEGNPVDVPCDVVPLVVVTNNAELHVLVKDNTIANNSFAGIIDTTSANNLYTNNVAFNNGTNFVGPIFAAGTPIRSWTVSSPPSNANNNGVVGDKLDNLNGVAP